MTVSRLPYEKSFVAKFPVVLEKFDKRKHQTSLCHSLCPPVQCILMYILGGARVKYFNLPIGDINSPSYNKFTEGIDFFQQATQTLGRAL